MLANVSGSGTQLARQARELATDRGIACAILDYDALRGLVPDGTLF